MSLVTVSGHDFTEPRGSCWEVISCRSLASGGISQPSTQISTCLLCFIFPHSAEFGAKGEVIRVRGSDQRPVTQHLALPQRQMAWGKRLYASMHTKIASWRRKQTEVHFCSCLQVSAAPGDTTFTYLCCLLCVTETYLDVTILSQGPILSAGMEK